MQSASREPTFDEIEQFLKTRTQAQIMQLVQNFDDPVQRAHFVSTFLNAPRINVKSKASSKHAKESEAIKAKKALNAFVAFRCFYIHCLGFKPWPMKKLSNSLGKMWELDLNKPLWSMMAKAWSLIRDQIGKDNASLTEFLNIVCPYLNIPPCKDYLDLFQWEVNISDEGLPVVRRDPEAPIQKDRASGTAPKTLSVKDIIEHCQMSGYALNFVYDTSATSAFQVQIGSVLNSSTGAADSVFQDRVVA
ncbi:mating-type protein MAT alpha 1, partial [Aaosphaeria arxii CBS 175.79]